MRPERLTAAPIRSTNRIEFNVLRRGVVRAARFREALPRPRFRRSAKLSATIPKFVDDEKQTKRYFVSGNVQGVGYRFFVQRVAAKLGLGGYARNLLDGRVEVLAIGSPVQLNALKTELERGPRFASVSAVREEEAQPSPLFETRFVIEPDA